MVQDNKYFAFISYDRRDEDWAKWLAHEIEHYHLPTKFNDRSDLPQELRPVFRDVDELSAGNLPDQIKEALNMSINLIVVCSPRSAQSEWVNLEIEEFKRNNGVQYIFPFIVEGIARSKNKKTECFPPALLSIPDDEERCGANVNEHSSNKERLRFCHDCPLPKENKRQGDISEKGRDAAVVKIIAGMLGLKFDVLWERREKEKAEEERKIREERDALLKLQSRFLAEKANNLTEDGDIFTSRLIAVEALRKSYTKDAEIALRRTYDNDSFKLPGHAWPVTDTVFDISGNFLASTSGDNMIYVWSLNDGRHIHTLKGHKGKINFIQFNADSRLIVSSSKDKTIRIWNIMTGKQTYLLNGHKQGISHAMFSHDDMNIISASTDGEIRIWDYRRAICLESLHEHSDKIESLAYNPKREEFLSLSNNNICIWNQRKQELICKAANSQSHYIKATYSPDGGKIMCVSYDNYVGLHDCSTFELTSGFTATGYGNIVDITFSTDGRFILSKHENNRIVFWDSQSFKYVKSIRECSTNNLCCSKNLLACGLDNGNISLLNIVDDTSEYSLVTDETPYRLGCYDFMTFTPDMQNVIAGTWKHIHMCNLVTKTSKKIPLSLNICNLVYSNDGRLSAFVSDEKILIWNMQERCIANTMIGHMEYITSIKFSPDNNNIISASLDRTVRIWNVNTGECVKILKVHKGPIYSASYSNNGKYFITSSVDNTLRIWNSKTYKTVKLFDNIEEGVAYSTFILDDKYILYEAEGYVNIMNINLAKVERKIKGVFAGVNKEGTLLAIKSRDYTVNICDTLSGERVQTLVGHKDDINQVIFSDDKKTIITSSDDGFIKVWKYPSLDTLIDTTVRNLKNRVLSKEERQRYYID